jgi:sulfate/thiosulfate transport system substrate-binding protein
MSNLLAKRVGMGAVAIAVTASAAMMWSTSTDSSARANPQPTLISQAGNNSQITLVSYAVTKAAYEKIIPLFVADWKQKTGETVTFKTSYAGSGTQTRAIIDGLPADVVNLALAGDVKKIEKAGLIKAGWEKEVPNSGIVTRSVVALETRDGNPKQIKTWSDLAKPGIGIVTANPKTSGVAKWNFAALWGFVAQNGGSEAQASQFVSAVYKNAVVLAKDAREASDIFYKKGQGDVLLNYENEVILAAKQGKTAPAYTVPSVNIAIETPVAVIDKNVDKHGNRKVAEAFVKFLFTPPAQREFAKTGFRPVNSTVAAEFNFPKIAKLFTIGSLGGWDAVDRKFFADGGVFDKIYANR